MNKTKTSLIALVLLLCNLTASAYDFEVDGIYYIITSNDDLTVGVTRNNSEYADSNNKYIGEIIIPEYVSYGGKQYSITSIEYRAFSGCTELTKINIPNTVISIKGGAFDGCTSLKEITIPNSVTSFEQFTFDGCTSLPVENFVRYADNWAIGVTDNTRTRYTLRANTVGLIMTFQNCYNLTSIKLPNSLKSISDCAFSGCSSLTAIDFNSQIKHLGYRAFFLCSNLETVSNTDGLEFIGEEAFERCSNLRTISIPASVRHIGMAAFKECNLSSVTLPKGITEIENYTFYKNQLREIIIPEGVTRIGRYAFEDCYIDSVSLPQSLTHIGTKAFHGNFISVIEIPENVIYVEDGAFNVNTLVLNSPTIFAEGNLIYKFGYEDGFYSLHNYVLGPQIKEIEDYKFCNDKYLEHIALPDNLSRIGEGVFENSSLLTISIPANVTEIGDYAFAGSSLSSIMLNESLERIGNYTFKDCHGLTKIVIPNSVTNIGNGTFSGCTGLTDVYSYAEVLPNIQSDALPDNIGEAKLHVLYNLVDSCKSTSPWNQFGEILPITRTITYFIDDKIYAIDTIPYLAKVDLMKDPIKEGYTFSGWSEYPVVMPNKDIAISGNFTVNKYGITFVVDQEIVISDSLNYGSEIVTPEIPQKEGYTFTWGSELPDSMPARDVIVEGSFTVNRYRLTYLLDSMEYSVDSIAYGTELIQKDSLFKEGYTFSGWSELPDSMPAKDVTVEGSFTVNRYRLTYLLDSMEYSVDSIAYGTELIQKDSLFKEGYTFSGWSELPDSMPAKDITVEGSFTVNRYRLTYLLDSMEYSVDSIAYGTELIQKDSLFKEGYTFSGWSELPTMMPAKDVIIEGKFTVNSYRLVYLLDGAEFSIDSIAYGTELVQKDALTKEGHTFSGWSEIPATMPAQDVTVEGSFAVNSYRLVYLLDGAEYSVDVIAYGTELVQKDALTKEGHTFCGWSEIPETMPARDVIVEGTFIVNHYTLLYMVDGEVYASEEVAYGETIVLKEIPLKDGYAFSGWSEIPATMPANDLTVTGTFTPLVYCDTPTISYDNGKLTFDCTTDGAECVANIVSDDFLEHIGNEMELTLTYQVNVYAKAEGHANSEVVTATICWIECDHQSGAHETTAIPATVVLIQSSNGIISIKGLEEGTSVSVYTTSGMEVVNGVAKENVTLTLDTQMTKGEVAIVKMGAKSVKVVMK